MKIYIIQFTKYDSWLTIKQRCNLKVYKDRALANHFMVAQALEYAACNYSVSLLNDGVYINTMKAESKNTKVCEEEIIEIAVKEMEVI